MHLARKILVLVAGLAGLQYYTKTDEKMQRYPLYRGAPDNGTDGHLVTALQNTSSTVVRAEDPKLKNVSPVTTPFKAAAAAPVILSWERSYYRRRTLGDVSVYEYRETEAGLLYSSRSHEPTPRDGYRLVGQTCSIRTVKEQYWGLITTVNTKLTGCQDIRESDLLTVKAFARNARYYEAISVTYAPDLPKKDRTVMRADLGPR